MPFDHKTLRISFVNAITHQIVFFFEKKIKLGIIDTVFIYPNYNLQHTISAVIYLFIFNFIDRFFLFFLGEDCHRFVVYKCNCTQYV